MIMDMRGAKCDAVLSLGKETSFDVVVSVSLSMAKQIGIYSPVTPPKIEHMCIELQRKELEKSIHRVSLQTCSSKETSSV